jgi:hypothetical protein
MRNPFEFNPVRLPPGSLRHVGSYKGRDGKVLKIMRYPTAWDPNDDGPVGWEQDWSPLPMGEIKREPMKVPTGGLFYLDYKYEKDSRGKADTE